MRSIPSDILNKINKLLQTQAENADPKIELVMQRTKRYIERGSELQVTDVRQGPNLGAMDLGLRRENHLKAPDMVYMIYIMEGIAKAARQPYLDSIEKKGAWEYLFDIGPAVDVAIEFDGYWMPASKDAEICFDSPANWTKVTAGEPWYFRVLADGSLTAQQGATGDSITLAPTGVTKVSAVRGWKSVATGSLDQGLIVAYVKDGTVCYRNYAEQADGTLLWESEKTVPELGTAAVNLAAFRTNDYRSGIIAEDAGTLKWVITSRNWAGMATPPERLEVSLEDLKLKLQPIMQLLIGDGPYPTDDKRHWGTKAEWPAEKISVSLEGYAPMLLWASDTVPVSVENVPINDEIEDEALGTGDGTIKVYGLAHVPIDDEDYPVVIYVDAVEAEDYAIDGKEITFDTAPESGAAITADYAWENWGKQIKVVFDHGITELSGQQLQFALVDDSATGYAIQTTTGGDLVPPIPGHFAGTREILLNTIDFNTAGLNAKMTLTHTSPALKGEAGQDVGSFTWSFIAVNLVSTDIPAPELEAMWNE